MGALGSRWWGTQDRPRARPSIASLKRRCPRALWCQGSGSGAATEQARAARSSAPADTQGNACGGTRDLQPAHLCPPPPDAAWDLYFFTTGQGAGTASRAPGSRSGTGKGTSDTSQPVSHPLSLGEASPPQDREGQRRKRQRRGAGGGEGARTEPTPGAPAGRGRCARQNWVRPPPSYASPRSLLPTRPETGVQNAECICHEMQAAHG